MERLLLLDACHLDHIHWHDHQVELVVHRVAPQARCPRCQMPSSAIHSYYVRTIRDLPWADYAVIIRLRVRRFCCRHATCPQRIFVEPLGAVIPRSARRTHRLTRWLQRLLMQTTAHGLAPVTTHMAIPASPRTLLRLMHAVPDPVIAPPTVIGIDDWAWKKGRSYGTICVDLERRRPIALEPFCRHQRRALQAAAHALNQTKASEDTHRALPPSQILPKPRREQLAHAQWHEQAATRYYTIHGMLDQQLSVAAIAHTLGLMRKTVYRYLRMTEPPRCGRT